MMGIEVKLGMSYPKFFARIAFLSFSWITCLDVASFAIKLNRLPTTRQKANAFIDEDINYNPQATRILSLCNSSDSDEDQKKTDKGNDKFLSFIKDSCKDDSLEEVQKILDEKQSDIESKKGEIMAYFKENQEDLYSILKDYLAQKNWIKYLESSGSRYWLMSLSDWAFNQHLKGEEDGSLYFAWCIRNPDALSKELKDNDPEGYKRISPEISTVKWFNWIARPISGRIVYWLTCLISWLPPWPIMFGLSMWFACSYLPFGFAAQGIIEGLIFTSLIVTTGFLLIGINNAFSIYGINFFTNWDNGEGRCIRWLAMLSSEGIKCIDPNNGNEFNLTFCKLTGGGKSDVSKQLLEAFINRNLLLLPSGHGRVLSSIGNDMRSLNVTPKDLLEKSADEEFKKSINEIAAENRYKYTFDSLSSLAIVLKFHNEITRQRWFNFACLNSIISAALLSRWDCAALQGVSFCPCKPDKAWSPAEICLLRAGTGWDVIMIMLALPKIILYWTWSKIQEMFNLTK